MTYIETITINGKKVEIDSLTKEEQLEIVNELNRRAVERLGYQQIKTA